MQGYTNKAHLGFLGHSYLGEWVNIGAMTTNSDLKNTYGTIRVVLDGFGQVDSGILKLGCFLADHVKLGIGLHLNGGAGRLRGRPMEANCSIQCAMTWIRARTRYIGTSLQLGMMRCSCMAMAQRGPRPARA